MPTYSQEVFAANKAECMSGCKAGNRTYYWRPLHKKRVWCFRKKQTKLIRL